MATVTVSNIPSDLYDLLRRSAAINRRSINDEVIACMEKTLRSQPMDTEVLLAQAREVRRKTKDHVVTEDEITQAKIDGRL